MNGRMYDYINSRMLSPDNFVHDDQGTQGYNRYSYVVNNPLKYTDPTGEDGEWDYDYDYYDRDYDRDWGYEQERWDCCRELADPRWQLDSYDTRSWSDFEQEMNDDYQDLYIDDNYVREYKNNDDIIRIRNSFDATRGIGLDGVLLASKGDEKEKSVQKAKDINEAIDNGLNVTNGLLVGAQKVSNASKEVLFIEKIPVLGPLAKASGVVSIIVNGKEFIANPKQNWWSGVKTIGSLGFLIFGGEAAAGAELIWNLGTITVDGVIYIIKK